MGNPDFLVVTGSIASQLKDLRSQVLHDSSHVDWGSSSDMLSIVSLAEETRWIRHTGNWRPAWLDLDSHVDSSGPYRPFLLAPVEGIGGPPKIVLKSFLHNQMTE